MSDVLTLAEGRLGRLRLHRPKALHALNTDMCEAMLAALDAWATDPAIEAILIDHAEGRGFCAGGDIRMLAESGATDGVVARAFFHVEYRLNHRLFSYAKTTVAFMDGITMGGGVGLSLPCDFRIATENTKFAMPETGIGLFPDVGGMNKKLYARNDRPAQAKAGPKLLRTATSSTAARNTKEILGNSRNCETPNATPVAPNAASKPIKYSDQRSGKRPLRAACGGSPWLSSTLISRP